MIQPVPEATKWVSSMLTVVKPGKVREDKCQFKFKEVPYIGHLLMQDCLRSIPERVRAVVEIKELTNVPELRRLVKTIQNLAKFIPSLSQIMQPLREVLKKTTTWERCF